MPAAHARTVTLPTIIDLDALDPIRDELLDAVESGSVEVKAEGVERVSTNALIMLLSAAETARRSQIAFSLSGASAPLLAAISRLGLSSRFAPILEGN